MKHFLLYEIYRLRKIASVIILPHVTSKNKVILLCGLWILLIFFTISCNTSEERQVPEKLKIVDLQFSSNQIFAGTFITITPILNSHLDSSFRFDYEFSIKILTDSVFRILDRRLSVFSNSIAITIPDSANAYWKIDCQVYSQNDSDTISRVLRILPYSSPHRPSYLGSESSCLQCHLTYLEAWRLTAHSTTGNRRLMNPNWQDYCNSCHTTGYHLSISNGGYDERPIGRFDHVQCESCHGASEFYGNSFSNHLASQGFIQSDSAKKNCSICHQHSHQSIYQDWLNSGHAQSSNRNHFIHSIDANHRATCAQCHIYSESIKKLKNEIHFEYPSDDSRFEGVGCATCHSPHNTTTEYHWKDLRYSPSQICNQCHQANIDGLPSAYAVPYHPQNDLMSCNLSALFGYEQINLPSVSEHSELANQCSICHLYSTQWNFGMQGETSHRFLPNYRTCIRCHPNATNDFITQKQQPYRDSLSLLSQHLEYLKTQNDTLSFAYKQGRWFYWFLTIDGSWGIHNPTWVSKILWYSITNLDSLTK